MKRILVIAVVVLVGMLHCIPALCANAEAVAAKQYNVEFYDRWANLPTDTLMAWGSRYLNNNIKRDSALLCYTIVANRYYEGGQNARERKRSIEAMNNIGYLFFYTYYDYQQAYTWLQKALTLAEQHNIQHIKPHALLNLGNLMTMLNLMNDSDSHERALDYYQRAWQLAVDEQEWSLAMIIATNLCNTVTEGGKSADDAALTTLKQQLTSQPIPPTTPMYNYVRHLLDMLQTMNKGDYKRGLALCDTIEQSIDVPYNPERYLVYIYSMRAVLCSHLGDDAQTLDWLNKTKQLAVRDSVRDMQVEVEKEFYEYYLEKGDLATAHRYQLSYLTKRDSLLNQGKLVKASELYFLNQLQEVNKQAEQTALYNRIWRWVVLGLVLVIAVIGALLIFLRRKNKQLEQDRRRMYLKMQETINMEKTIQKYRKSTLDDNTKDDLAVRIQQVMEQTDVICDEGFNREKLAEILGTTVTNVSQVLNERMGMNFSQLLNEYRVKEACRRFSNQEQYGNYTIEAVAASVGLKSRSTFAANFKKVTGLSPSEYLREARKKN